MTQTKLFGAVYVPNCMELLTEIRENCGLCRTRLARSHQPIFGPLPSTSLMWTPGPFTCTMFDQGGPYRCRLFKSSRETRHTQFTKVYLVHFVCMVTKAVHIEICEDMSAPSLASSIMRLACRWQVPAYFYCDQASSNIHTMKNAEFQVRVKEILYKQTGFTCEFAPVGSHHMAGLSEARVKASNRMIGSLNLEAVPMGMIDLISTVSLISDMINEIPLGVSLSTDQPELRLVTPNKLLGKISFFLKILFALEMF